MYRALEAATLCIVIGIAGCETTAAPAGKDAAVADTDEIREGTGANMLSFEEMRQLAARAAAEEVSDEARRSLPIPRRLAGHLSCGVFFANSAGPRDGPRLLYPPNYLCSVNSVTGKTSLKIIAPSDFGFSHEPDRPLGEFDYPPEVTVDSLLEDQEELCHILDRLAPHFSVGTASNEPAIAADVERAKEIYSQLIEPPLRDYYLKIGRKFFAWIGLE